MQVDRLRKYFPVRRGFFQKITGWVRAVEDVSFTIGKRKTLGLVGESGCGKSVSVLSMIRLIPTPPGKITDGKVLFEGRDLLTMDNDEIRHIRGNRIAMIFQDPYASLNPRWRVDAIVSEPIQAFSLLKGKQAKR